MQGLELGERFYREEVGPLVDGRFPALQGRYAAGLTGYGSDVLGHDDELSRDHEWGPRCFLWLRERDYRRYAPDLDEVLDRELPRTFLGFQTRFRVDRKIEALVPVAGGEEGLHHVVITTVRRHLGFQIGSRRLPHGALEWLSIPEQRLLEFVRGQVFADPVGEITGAREALAYLPDGVWRYKMLYGWSILGWQLTNISLCAGRGDALSARFALHKCVEACVQLAFLLNRRYRPGTIKWLSREFCALPEIAAGIGPLLEEALTSPDLGHAAGLMDGVAQQLAGAHNRLGITAPVAVAKQLYRGQLHFSPDGLMGALRASLPPDLAQLEIQGGCDQWVSNEDVLIWAKHFRRLEPFYRGRTDERRDGVGDMMI